MQRAFVALVVVALVGAAAWFVLGGDGGPTGAGPPGTTPDTENAPADGDDESATFDPGARGVVPPAAEPPADPDVPTPTTPDPLQAELPDDDAPLPKLALEVVDRPSGAPVERFGYTVYAGDDRLQDRRVDGGRTTFELLPDQEWKITVEAPGHQPAERRITLNAAERERMLRVELEPVASIEGVVLRLNGADGQPITHVRVRARRRPIDAPNAELQAVWSRRATETGGEYRLPDLAPGFYAFELQPLEADGRVAPFVGRVLEVTYYGNELHEPTVTFAPGAIIALLVRDPNRGTPLGPEVALRVERADGSVVETTWQARVDDELLEAVDTLPAAQRCELASPLPVGDYVWHLQRGDGETVTRRERLQGGRVEWDW